MPDGYQQPSGDVALCSWSYAIERLEQSENYWLATVRPDGRPHVTPVWGVWVDGALYFDGIPTSHWARNLALNPALAVHLESGTQVLILEGAVEDLETDPDLGRRVMDAWETKYRGEPPQPATRGIFRLRPRTARGWTQFPEDATLWTFDAQ
jgi:nitroimidazol reductase NimA-like FMN-containing flavoprotein (pyridoxamine 5'-phosphate oxidase superfamily)